MKLLKFPIRYLPKVLTKKDTNTQVKMLIKLKKLYKINIIHVINYPLTKIKN